MKDALIIMIKNPELGKVKTRLAAEIGEQRALDVYLQLLQHTCEVAQLCTAERFIFYSDVVDRNDQFSGQVFKKYVQCSGDLGVRMDYAFSIPFKNEFRKVVMIGSDCLALTPQHLELAFQQLNDHDFVIGPAEDGGYYLIGMKKWNRWIFENKSWSTAHVLQETRDEILKRQGKLFELETLYDIDSVEDAKRAELIKE